MNKNPEDQDLKKREPCPFCDGEYWYDDSYDENGRRTRRIKPKRGGLISYHRWRDGVPYVFTCRCSCAVGREMSQEIPFCHELGIELEPVGEWKDRLLQERIRAVDKLVASIGRPIPEGVRR